MALSGSFGFWIDNKPEMVDQLLELQSTDEYFTITSSLIT